MAVASAAGFAGASTAANPPSVRSLPYVTGAAQAGRTLTARNGDWAGTRPLRFAYQWRRCEAGGGSCVDVAGATARTYVLAADDVGHRLRVRVTATNEAGPSSAGARPAGAGRPGPAAPPPPPGA